MRTRLAALARTVAPSAAAFVGPALAAFLLYLLTVGHWGTAAAAAVIAGPLGLLGSACADAVRSGIAHRREVADMTAIADSLHGAQLYVAPDDTVRVQFADDPIRLTHHEGTERLHRDIDNEHERNE